MPNYDSRQNNAAWEEIRFQTVCDLNGYSQPVTTYSSGNQFRIDPSIEFDFVTEAERIARREAEESERERAAQRRHTVMTIIMSQADRHFTPTQKEVLTLFLQGYNWTEIGRIRDCSDVAASEVFYGNKLGQGGIVRKLRKVLGENYFDFS